MNPLARLFIAPVAVVPVTTKPPSTVELSDVEAKAIVTEVFFSGMHPVAVYHLRYNFAQNEKSPFNVGINRLGWDRIPMKALPCGSTARVRR